MISPQIEAAVSYKQLKNTLQQTPHNIPDVVVPDIDIIPIAEPIKARSSLPDVSVSVMGMVMFQKPEKHNTELPAVSRPYY